MLPVRKTSISVLILTFLARKAEEAGVVVVLEENMVSVSDL